MVIHTLKIYCYVDRWIGKSSVKYEFEKDLNNNKDFKMLY